MHIPAACDQLMRSLGVLRLSLTARCNLACPCCLPDGQEPTGVLSLEQRRGTDGEPLLHPQLEQLIDAVQQLRAREIALTTNGSLLSCECAR